jgi:hypothetical protein
MASWPPLPVYARTSSRAPSPPSIKARSRDTRRPGGRGWLAATFLFCGLLLVRSAQTRVRSRRSALSALRWPAPHRGRVHRERAPPGPARAPRVLRSVRGHGALTLSARLTRVVIISASQHPSPRIPRASPPPLPTPFPSASIAFGFSAPAGSGSRPPSCPPRSHAHSCPTGARGLGFARRGGPSLPPTARVAGGRPSVTGRWEV